MIRKPPLRWLFKVGVTIMIANLCVAVAWRGHPWAFYGLTNAFVAGKLFEVLRREIKTGNHREAPKQTGC